MSNELNREQSHAESIAVKAEELRAAAEDMEEAARRAGIEPDLPLAVWVRTLRVMMEHNAELVSWQAREIDGTLAGILKVSRAESERLKAATAASEAQSRKMEGIIASVDVRAHALLTQTINQMAGEVAERMRDRMVIVERRHNRWVLGRTGALIAVVLLGTLGGGYAWCAYADRAATALMDRCLTHPVQDPRTGQLFCQLEATQPGQ